MSLRLRLTLLNVLVLALVIGVFATVAYVTQAQFLQRSLDLSLQDQARDFSTSSRVSFDPFSRSLFVRVADPQVFAAPDFFVQIMDAQGEISGRSKNLGEAMLPTDQSMLAEALSGKEWFSDIWVDGQPLRQFVGPVRITVARGESANAGMVQVARPLGPTYATLRTLQTTLFGLGALGVFVSLLAGWILARAALRPIDRLAATAHTIGAAQDLDQRVPTVRGRRDEVGRLAEEFNGMLARLQDAYSRVEAALAAQRRFVADASHELRTPLTSLRGNVDLLRRMAAHQTTAGASSLGEHEQLLADMASETVRMARLVDDLLLLAQADAGQHLQLRPTPLRPVIRDAFRTARFLREGVQLVLGQEPPETALVRGDADRLKQVLLILLDNALKYTPEGGQVTIDGSLEERDGVPGAVLRVVDTGAGIPAGDMARIFERFYRSDPARGAGGAGLGLAIARWIVDEHNGRISADSANAVGSTFTIWLPVEDAVTPAAPESAPDPDLALTADAARTPAPHAEPPRLRPRPAG